MKKIFFIITVSFLFVVCNKKTKVEKEVEAIPVEVKVVRFDKLFFETNPANFGKLKKQFPYFFPVNDDDSVWLNKMQNPLWRELYTEVQHKYSNLEPTKKELEKLFKQI